MIAGALLLIVGTQVVALGLCAHAYGTYFMGEKDPWFDRMRASFRLEHGLLLGGAILFVGVTLEAVIVGLWIERGLGALSEERLAVLGATLIIVGIQIFFSSFLLEHPRPASAGLDVLGGVTLATSVLEDATAWVALPVVVAISCLGLGLLAERLAGVRLPTALLLPTGLCLSIVAVLPGYEVGAGGVVGALVLTVGVIAGFVVGRHGLAERLRPGPAGAAALAVLGLYLAPVVLSGGWTWAGYNFLNDTAVQFLLADHLRTAGAGLPTGPLSTQSEVVRIYLESAYPLGTHGHLASLATLTGAGVDVIYQGYLSMLAAITALALAALGRRSGLGPWAAAAAGAGGAASTLFYQYALQGSIKEVGALACFVTAGALGRELLAAERPVGAAALVGLAGAAMFSALSAPALPFLGLLALLLVGGAFLLPEAVEVRRRLVPSAAAGTAVLSVCAVPTLLSALTFAHVASTALSPTSVATSTLGQLARPLEAIQVAGVWITGRYTQPIVDPTLDVVTRVLSFAVLALLLVGIVVALRRREPGVATLAVAVLVAGAIVEPRASPYADAKLLALASPIVLFGALFGALSLRGRARMPGIVAAAVVALGVLWSDAEAYHSVNLAPVERMQALEQAADTTQGRGLVLFDEVEEFGKYYGRHARLNAAFEAITPKQARPQGGGYHLDLDRLDADYVREFDTIILRRGPATGRPPSDFEERFANAYYSVWERRTGVEVITHLPLGAVNDRTGIPSCADVRAVAEAARDGWVVAAGVPETVQVDPATLPSRPVSWPPVAVPPGVVNPTTPGRVEARRTVEGGVYDVWIRGSSGRPLIVRIEGQEVSAQGINTQSQWLRAGTVSLRPGLHELELERPGGGLSPGDGAIGELGPVAFVRRERTGLRRVRPAAAEQLCGKRWDWIEAVAG